MNVNSVIVSRIKSIDIARGIAILIMLGDHLLDATMLKSYQQYSIYETWMFLRSFTAPLFLVISGCAIFVATKKKWELHINFGLNFRKRIGRGLFLILVGYILHLPTPYFAEFATANNVEMLKFIASDILRLIGFMLIFLEILVVVLRSEQKFVLISFIFLIIGLFVSPYIWEIKWGGNIQRIFLSYLNTSGAEEAVSSSFTIFPYGLFVFAGVILGWFWSRNSKAESNLKRRLVLTLAAVCIVLLGLLIKQVFDEEWIHWRTRPSQFLINLGGALFIILIIDCLTTLLKPHKIFQIVGTETLAIYIVHLPIVYGSIYNKGFNFYFYDKWNLGLCIIVFLILSGFMITYANLWHSFKNKFKKGKYILVSAILAVIILNGFLKIF